MIEQGELFGQPPPNETAKRVRCVNDDGVWWYWSGRGRPPQRCPRCRMEHEAKLRQERRERRKAHPEPEKPLPGQMPLFTEGE